MRQYLLNQLFNKNLIILIAILAVFSGCDKELSEIDENKVLRKLSAQEQELINSNNTLSINMLQAEYSKNQYENVLFSPLSVGMSLGMIYNGVGENEKAQIQYLMGLESLAEKEINKSYNELVSFLQVSDNQLNISFANSLWFSNEISIHEDFRTRVMAYYDAEISELNFHKNSSLDFINNWGNLKSHGAFEKLINVTPTNTSDIFLINAFALNTSWKPSYQSFSAKRDFYPNNGEKVKIDMINWDGMNVKLSENGTYSFVEIPLDRDQFFLSVITPQNTETIQNLIESFSTEELLDLTENAYDYKANVSLPDIKFSSERSLKSTLSTMGLNTLFLTTTDLSPSFVEKNKRISEINHLAKINLKANYSEFESKSSFSDLNLELVNVNRPFLYFVRDRHTKTILFAGYFVQPE